MMVHKQVCVCFISSSIYRVKYSNQSVKSQVSNLRNLMENGNIPDVLYIILCTFSQNSPDIFGIFDKFWDLFHNFKYISVGLNNVLLKSASL